MLEIIIHTCASYYTQHMYHFTGTIEDIEEVLSEIKKLREFEAEIPPPKDITESEGQRMQVQNT